MIWRLVWASARQRSGRGALLLGGYALGVAVTIVLLSVGQAMVDQARDRELLGGGDLIVLPAGIDLETLRTGGASSMYFAVEQAPLLYRDVLAGTRFAGRIAAAAPWIDDELLYLATDTALVPVSAGATIPDLAAAVGAPPDLLAGAWADLDADRRWRRPSTPEFYESLDGMHLPAGAAAGDTTWAEWHYFNVLLPDSGWLYLTYMVAGDLVGGRGSGRVLAARVAPRDGAVRVYAATVEPERVAFAEGHPDLAIGTSSVALREDGAYRLRARVPMEGAGAPDGPRAPPLTVDLTVSERSRRYLPPVDIGGGDFVSGYTVPLLDGRATGRVCEGARCHDLADARAYHDHNWGTWARVNWDWGQATAGGYSVLYGGVARTEEGGGTTLGGRFLYLADSHGFAGVFTVSELVTRWPGPEGRGNPESIGIHAVNGRDSLALRVTIGHTQVTRVPVAAADEGDARFYQMRGTAELTGRLGGAEVRARGDGFFETWTRAP